MNSLWTKQMFDTTKPVIAMVHFPALPGAPLYDGDGGMDSIVDVVKKDVAALQEAQVDGIMFCNENDRPYEFAVGPSTVAAMSYVIGRVKEMVSVPYGVDILWDPVAAVALAHAVGASFVREVFTGTYDSDMGLWQSRAAEAVRLRAQLGDTNRVALLFNVSAEFASPLGRRSVAEIARSVAFSSLPDGICVSGPMTGNAVESRELDEVKKLVISTPIFVNTGVREDNVAEYLSIADGVIIGTALKMQGQTFNPVDVGRACKFMAAVQKFRNQFAM